MGRKFIYPTNFILNGTQRHSDDHAGAIKTKLVGTIWNESMAIFPFNPVQRLDWFSLATTFLGLRGMDQPREGEALESGDLGRPEGFSGEA